MLPTKGPDPDGPGGLGAEDPVPKESGHRRECFLAIQRGGCLTEIGLHYDFWSTMSLWRCLIAAF
jgi:hypothetical protein